MVQVHHWNGNRYIDAGGYWARFTKTVEGKTLTVMLHREVMAQKLGRPLHRNEVVHHIDHDRKNNRPENLELLTRSAHASHHHIRPTEKLIVVCLECGEQAEKLARQVRGNRKKNKEGPFCGRECAGRWNQRKRKQGASGGGGRPRKSTWTDEEALRLLATGMSANAVAKQLDASRHAIVNVMKKHVPG